MGVALDLFRKSPEEALEAAFCRTVYHYKKDTAFLYQSLRGTDGKLYGSSKVFTRDSLKNRKYRIEFWNDAVSIFWLDVLHDPQTFKSIPLEICDTIITNDCS